MGKLKQLTVAIAIMALPLAFALPARAADCTITNTGPGSNNECQSTSNYTCVVNQDNTITVTNLNGQTVGTGTASTSGNTTGGSSSTGTASNTNGTTFSVDLSNEGCVVTAVNLPETPKPSTGGGSTEGKTVAPVSLPYTAGDNTPVMIIGVIAASLVLVSAVSAYTTIKNRL